MFILEPSALQGLITVLQAKGFAVVGPTVRDGSITFDTITSMDELPRGWSDNQEPSHYAITDATMMRCLPTMSVRIPGRSSCSPPGCVCLLRSAPGKA